MIILSQIHSTSKKHLVFLPTDRYSNRVRIRTMSKSKADGISETSWTNLPPPSFWAAHSLDSLQADLPSEPWGATKPWDPSTLNQGMGMLQKKVWSEVMTWIYPSNKLLQLNQDCTNCDATKHISALFARKSLVCSPLIVSCFTRLQGISSKNLRSKPCKSSVRRKCLLATSGGLFYSRNHYNYDNYQYHHYWLCFCLE